jgi:hypothetical protein
LTNAEPSENRAAITGVDQRVDRERAAVGELERERDDRLGVPEVEWQRDRIGRRPEARRIVQPHRGRGVIELGDVVAEQLVADDALHGAALAARRRGERRGLGGLERELRAAEVDHRQRDYLRLELAVAGAAQRRAAHAPQVECGGARAVED